MEEQKVLLMLENIQAMVKANLEGQKAFEEAFERRLSALEKGVDCLNEKMQWAANAVRDLRQEVGAVQGEIVSLKADVAELKAEMAAVKADVAELKTEMAVVKADVAELKVEMASVKEEIANLRAENTTQHQKMERRLNVLAGEFGRQHIEIEMLKANAGW
ncbi:hypothetical protein [Neomoorella mulderi]|uniref:Chromosome partition protein Smc n=1 Tax=Moorella mulderi DSM 14980 TaxID=1122241 RepID=A0A151B0P9_9FIRM|nr:hypothetical protein [Moorella mulderi]KYH33495.1 chromosome partition protein Smc [Moorella mulderi DSM 14980]